MGVIEAFVDSNVIIKHLTGDVNLSELRKRYKLYSNIIVFSEVYYVYLKALTDKKSYQLKKNREVIKERAKELQCLHNLFKIFEELDINKEIRIKAQEYITKEGLLPNDAIIVATLKQYRIKRLISFDDDFKEVCEKEEIELIKK
ncbi:MAG: type II toxin-antitoxin system VapC family toxin [Candidatus Heimdallarchaeaceae archaeon]